MEQSKQIVTLHASQTLKFRSGVVSTTTSGVPSASWRLYTSNPPQHSFPHSVQISPMMMLI